MKNLVVLSGAGISADSGLTTFRDSGGLWEGYNIEDVASIEGWYRDKEKVLEFYNIRRRQASEAKPNPAHHSVKNLEEAFNVTVITQNVDDLHERAGSSRILHLHGKLREARSEKNPELIVDIGSDPIKLGDKASDGHPLRPNVVWFGEAVPNIHRATEIVKEADLLIVVGTSLAVYPAAGLIDYAKKGIPKYIVDPATPDLFSFKGWTHIKKNAAKGLPELEKKLLNKEHDK
ncbi:MAG: NAD-dependent deacylase [Balneolaceae bacterium]